MSKLTEILSADKAIELKLDIIKIVLDRGTSPEDAVRAATPILEWLLAE